MRAGAYRTPVALEQPVHTAAADGSASLVYLFAGDDFAQIKPLRQSETLRSGRLEGIATHQLRLRYRDDLAGGWRVLCGPRAFRILSTTAADDRSREIICLAEEEGT
ncbi:head-tail adaptor protein [Roseibium polysiphoniae]|uniref:Head-tail adaptor protein n=1 Tax=Roseibium polysiphoniae TaxID=2571221 RepID=A0ABR9C4Z1_9HYPH|nr:head-tail adaptor protein [Roseibium polysiphoniae]